jgi:hypothetical protein
VELVDAEALELGSVQIVHVDSVAEQRLAIADFRR